MSSYLNARMNVGVINKAMEGGGHLKLVGIYGKGGWGAGETAFN